MSSKQRGLTKSISSACSYLLLFYFIFDPEEDHNLDNSRILRPMTSRSTSQFSRSPLAEPFAFWPLCCGE